MACNARILQGHESTALYIICFVSVHNGKYNEEWFEFNLSLVHGFDFTFQIEANPDLNHA